MHFVFVHLGKASCRWLIPNILDHDRRFQENTVLLADDPDLICVAKRNGIQVEHIIFPDELPPDQRTREFRHGFWSHTTNRFRALSEFHAQVEGPILHVESDVVLMDDFQTQRVLDHAGVVAYSLVAPQIGVGALVFLRNQGASLELSKSIMGVGPGSSSNNDMHRLGKFANDNFDSFTVFPSAPAHNPQIFRPGISSDFRYKVSKNLDHFGGIFDGASVGQYLFGLDPRNNRGFKTLGFSPPDHAINAGRLIYHSSGTSLFVESESGASVPFLNLHIHSKDLRMFTAKTRQPLVEKRVHAQHRGQRREFDPRAFTRWAEGSARHSIRRAAQVLNM